jgi:hypothetical protein
MGVTSQRHPCRDSVTPVSVASDMGVSCNKEEQDPFNKTHLTRGGRAEELDAAPRPEGKTAPLQNEPDASQRTKPPLPVVQVYVEDQTEPIVPCDLSELEYARELIEALGLPVQKNLTMVADAIRAFATYLKTSRVAAYTKMRAIAFDARNRGDRVDYFWFQDGNYVNPKRKSKSEIATDEFHARFARERAILERWQKSN